LIDPAFNTLPEAFWFAVVTVSTVGYGDYVPASGAGRVVAGALMLTGLALIPLITSVVVSILVSQRSREAREQELHHLNLILERLDGLERKLERLER
jgi:voltage-gated potassium channel